MSVKIQAVYAGGVLHPAQPLTLDEGATVEVTINSADLASAPLLEPEIIKRIQACKTYQDWLEVTKLLPPDDGGYDIVRSLDENRRWAGERSLQPDEGRLP